MIANSIVPTFCSLTVGAVPHASSSRERRTVVVCHVVGHVTFCCRHHQTFRWLGSTSLNSKLFGCPSPRRSNVNAKFFGTGNENDFRTMT